MKIKFFNKNKEQLPVGVKKILSPSREFTEKAKGRFLIAFDAHYHAAPAPRFALVMKLSVGVMALALILFGGASVYADTQNVPADSPLYSLKRLNEAVQLAVVPAQAKAELQATFAARRVTEIADLQERKPSSTIITKLETDANTDVEASITDAEQTNIQDGSLAQLCRRLFSTIATSSITFQGELSGNATALARFEGRCEGVGTNRGNPHDNGNNATTTNANANNDASTSAFVSSSTVNLETRIHDFLNHHFQSATTSASTTIIATGTITVISTSTVSSTDIRRGGAGGQNGAGSFFQKLRNYFSPSGNTSDTVLNASEADGNDSGQ